MTAFRKALLPLTPSHNPYSSQPRKRRYVEGWRARAFGEPIYGWGTYAWLHGWTAANRAIRGETWREHWWADAVIRWALEGPWLEAS